MRRLNLPWILVFLAPWVFSSCEKDELTKPAEVSFRFRLDREPSSDASIAFHTGTMDVESISFTGDRENGEDVAFISDFGTIVRADLGTGNTDPRIVFDIPQGTYKAITLLVDPDNTQPDIVITGQYIPRLLAAPVPLQVEIDLTDDLNLQVHSLSGTSEIVLRKDSRPTVDIFLNPSHWFADIAIPSLESADVQNIRGVPSVVISKDFNPDLYLKLSGLVNVSVEAVFQ